MKIFYIVNIRFPSERAHGIQIAQTCNAFAEQGHDVELIIPRRRFTPQIDPFEFYEIEKKFTISYVPCIDFIDRERENTVPFLIQSFTFLVCLVVRHGFRIRKGVVYGREEITLAPLVLCAKKVIWESHMGNDGFFARFVLNRVDKLVTITRGLADFYKEKGYTKEIHVAPDAVDVNKFAQITGSVKDIRNLLKLPQDKTIVTYSGSLGAYSWKGWDVLLDSLNHINNKDVMILLVGGSESEIVKLKTVYPDPRIIWIGQVKPQQVPVYLKASDILVLPNKAGDIISERFTSPMKLFEYMAAKKPIIASDLPSIREVLDNESAFFVESSNPEKLAGIIDTVTKETSKAVQISERAYKKVLNYSWNTRASGIIDFIQRHD